MSHLIQNQCQHTAKLKELSSDNKNEEFWPPQSPDPIALDYITQKNEADSWNKNKLPAKYSEKYVLLGGQFVLNTSVMFHMHFFTEL